MRHHKPKETKRPSLRISGLRTELFLQEAAVLPESKDLLIWRGSCRLPDGAVSACTCSLLLQDGRSTHLFFRLSATACLICRILFPPGDPGCLSPWLRQIQVLRCTNLLPLLPVTGEPPVPVRCSFGKVRPEGSALPVMIRRHP